MTRDFTLVVYERLLLFLESQGYTFITVKDALDHVPKKPPLVITRHDVDKNPDSAVVMGEIENDIGICSTYYFRFPMREKTRRAAIRLHEMGHEIGYHYESLTRARGDINRAVSIFREDLEELRKIAPVFTVVAHNGATVTVSNSRVWEETDVKDALGLLGDASCSISRDVWDYYSDTGRRWDGKFSVW
ncbi:MAG: hypothetical protein J7L61_00590, partial [Thermoplasmata archaeon]|nr:hypothetical protein [Thermoplasmata archaeon]